MGFEVGHILRECGLGSPPSSPKKSPSRKGQLHNPWAVPDEYPERELRNSDLWCIIGEPEVNADLIAVSRAVRKLASATKGRSSHVSIWYSIAKRALADDDARRIRLSAGTGAGNGPSSSGETVSASQ
eukprot:gnl/TRDRNA2_/TRDRNA2_168645_c5_seq2.p1 gnl/TRDRNA2_/TRDRNA2_168645_c5~~gnl/TRDRNA2_/TRDRNA2_168645_c5_seq2.p1  ORF type:complete len:141 (-),score=10.40 gnl/TRDRNA2_/TRDRNA2_168645_c5_seq2:20-403(-)